MTGSARLNLYKKGSDSLMGRYLNFLIHPFSLAELNNNFNTPEEFLKKFSKKEKATGHNQKILNQLLEFSGFPEPYLAKNKKILYIWQNSRVDKIIKEDLRDLSRITEISQIEIMAALLPDRVGSPLSIENIRQAIETTHPTAKRWLKYLEELYFFYEIKPWSLKIPNSLKKEGKIYLYDYSQIENQGPRFENLVANHLKKTCDFWTDIGEGNFNLFYLKNKLKEEIDFLITKNNKPWMAFEVKLTDQNIQTNKFKNFKIT